MNTQQTTETNEITARQIREVLFYLDNQKITVEELRKRLFDLDDQDTPIRIDMQMWRKMGI